MADANELVVSLTEKEGESESQSEPPGLPDPILRPTGPQPMTDAGKLIADLTEKERELERQLTAAAEKSTKVREAMRDLLAVRLGSTPQLPRLMKGLRPPVPLERLEETLTPTLLTLANDLSPLGLPQDTWRGCLSRSTGKRKAEISIANALFSCLWNPGDADAQVPDIVSQLGRSETSVCDRILDELRAIGKRLQESLDAQCDLLKDELGRGPSGRRPLDGLSEEGIKAITYLHRQDAINRHSGVPILQIYSAIHPDRDARKVSSAFRVMKAGLKKVHGLLDTTIGRNAVCWLTAKGIAIAQRLHEEG